MKTLFEYYKEVDNIIHNNLLNSSDLFKLLNESEKIENYFFSQIKNDNWFNLLKSKKYFYSKENPSPIKVKEGYQIPQWHILPYLENVSQTVREYDEDLIKIILDTTYFKLNGEYIDNYRTWWFFTKIITNIPLAKIPKELIEKSNSYLASF